MIHSLRVGAFTVLVAASIFRAWAEPKPYNLPATDLKQRVIWGATCESPDGNGVSFGGEDQESEDGIAHTRVLTEGQWRDIIKPVRASSLLRSLYDRTWELRNLEKKLLARVRFIYFEGLSESEETRLAQSSLIRARNKVADGLQLLVDDLRKATVNYPAYERVQALRAAAFAAIAAARVPDLSHGITAAAVNQLEGVRVILEQAADALNFEPSPRALSPIVYDERTKLFVLFGGDHLDYLTNDLWVFDPTKRAWMQRHSTNAPPPRANHKLKAGGDGKITMSGGYTYFSNTDYVGGQYVDINDGEWTYDLAKDSWTGPGAGMYSDVRAYRGGPFHPNFFVNAAKVEGVTFQVSLQSVPANTWTQTRPPNLPHLNRDWGTAALDPDHDLILRFSGGHSAHGGTDVLQYHLGANRWELPFPVEFPLGQLYSNTSYPEGWNFNHRPWVTGHTYQSYGYDPLAKKMIFTGQQKYFYVYDPDVGDWTGRAPKPKEMSYGSCYYTLTICATPQGLVCWTNEGKLFRFVASKNEWEELKTSGVALPGSVVDNSTIVYDSKRVRLLMAHKEYGDDRKYGGELYAVDLKTLTVSKLSPAGMSAAVAISYLCQIRYDVANDLFLVGATLPPDAGGFRRTPAYDPVGNRWVSLKITGDDPNGKEGRNVSLGLIYDAKRKLFWAVDTNSNVYILRLDAKTADVQPLQ